MKEIQLGKVRIVRRSVDAHLNSDAQQIEYVQTNLQVAQEIAGFRIQTPTSFPWDELTVEKVSVWQDPESDVAGTIVKYRNSSGQWMVVRQSLIGKLEIISVPFELTLAQLTPTSPAGVFFFEVPASNFPSGKVRIINCYWESGPFVIRLEAPHLNQDALLLVARSME